jgi:hypothetical protein
MLRASVSVGELKDWRLPRHWDSAAVRALGKGAFVAQMETWWRQGKLGLGDWEADGVAYVVLGGVDEARGHRRRRRARAWSASDHGRCAQLAGCSKPAAGLGMVLLGALGRYNDYRAAKGLPRLKVDTSVLLIMSV